MTKTITWAVTQAAVLAVVWAGYIEDIQGGRYVLGFYVWAVWLPVMTIAVLSEDIQKDLAKNPMTRSKRNANAVIAGAVLFVLVWNGHLVMAGAWFVSVVLGLAVRAAVDRIVSAKKAEATLQQADGTGSAAEQGLRDVYDAREFRLKDWP